MKKLETILFYFACGSMPIAIIMTIIGILTKSKIVLAIALGIIMFALLNVAIVLPIWVYNDYIQFEKPKKKERKDHR